MGGDHPDSGNPGDGKKKGKLRNGIIGQRLKNQQNLAERKNAFPKGQNTDKLGQ